MNKNEQQQEVGKIVLNCGPNGRRQIGRALKRLLDEGETGLSRCNWRRMMMVMVMMMMMMMMINLTLYKPSLRRQKKNSTAHS
jgi:hypothetical protein